MRFVHLHLAAFVFGSSQTWAGYRG
jgi:hypothetical protein